MYRRNWILFVLSGLLPKFLKAGPRSFVITERDVSGFVVTDRPDPSSQEEKGVTVQHPDIHPDDKIFLYSATWCGVCREAKKALEKVKDLPFVLDIIDVDKEGYPPGWNKLAYKLQTIPHFEWNTPEGRVYTKWKDPDDLIRKWLLSKEKKPEGLVYGDGKVQEGYVPRWNWPGKLSNHLKQVHRQNISGLSQDQMEVLHDKLHEGRK